MTIDCNVPAKIEKLIEFQNFKRVQLSNLSWDSAHRSASES